MDLIHEFFAYLLWLDNGGDGDNNTPLAFLVCFCVGKAGVWGILPRVARMKDEGRGLLEIREYSTI